MALLPLVAALILAPRVYGGPATPIEPQALELSVSVVRVANTGPSASPTTPQRYSCSLSVSRGEGTNVIASGALTLTQGVSSSLNLRASSGETLVIAIAVKSDTELTYDLALRDGSRTRSRHRATIALPPRPKVVSWKDYAK